LARTYGGDLASTDGCHLGRLAGFTNQKRQRRTASGYAPLGKDCGSSCRHRSCRTRVAAFGHTADSTAVDGGHARYYLRSLAHKQSIDHDYGPRSRPHLSTLDGALAYSGALSPARLEHHRSVAG
jgi:hypothetical protein